MSTTQLTFDTPRVILPATTTSTTVTSNVYYTEGWTLVGIQVDATSTSSANFSAQVQVSLDGVGWGNFGSTISITADNTYCFNATLVGFSKLRVVLTRTGGSGTFKIMAQGKQG